MYVYWAIGKYIEFHGNLINKNICKIIKKIDRIQLKYVLFGFKKYAYHIFLIAKETNCIFCYRALPDDRKLENMIKFVTLFN